MKVMSFLLKKKANSKNTWFVNVKLVKQTVHTAEKDNNRLVNYLLIPISFKSDDNKHYGLNKCSKQHPNPNTLQDIYVHIKTHH